ncbi:MAG TPA: hypothetical protein GXX36_16215 [Clostridiaceae bacterium]|nr:hypothetical protein [Clostridiaceae bacterium]
MRNYISFLLVITLCFIFLFTGQTVYAAGTDSFSIDAPSKVYEGDTFTVVVNGTGLGNFYGYDLRIGFNSDILTLEKVETQKDGFSVGPISKGNEVICAFTKIGDVPEMGGDLKLCAYTFKAKSAGTADITLNTVELVNKKLESELINVNKKVSINVQKKSTGGGGGGIYIPPEPSSEIIKGDDGTVRIKLQTSLDKNTGKAESTVDAKTLEEALSIAQKDSSGYKRVIVEIPETEGAEEYALVLPAEYVSKETANNLIEFRTPIGCIELKDNMFTKEQVGDEETVTIRIGVLKTSALDKDISDSIGNRPARRFAVDVGEKAFDWVNSNSPVSISIDYKPTSAELAEHEHIVVCYLDKDGNVNTIPNGRYNPSTKTVSFSVKHTGQYFVSFVKKSFSDLDGYGWARKAIEVMASKGIIKGTSETTFSPGEKILRADFVLLLVRTLELEADFDSNFDDVNPNDYYYEALGIAKKLGIAKGVGDNKFMPKENITRQEMMCFIDRALTIAGKGVERGTIEDIEKFADYSKVSSFAVESVASLVKSGIVAGDGTNINPLDYSLRAEAAVLMYRIYNR